MIPVAAFAVTATGVSAFNPDALDRVDVAITDNQVAALEEAHALRQAGADRSEIKEVLEATGLDRETMKEIRSAVHEAQQETREAVKAAVAAVAAEDYQAFLEVAPDRLLTAIASESDFALLLEAAELRAAGDKEGAQDIMSELGIEKPDREGKGLRGGERGERTER